MAKKRHHPETEVEVALKGRGKHRLEAADGRRARLVPSQQQTKSKAPT